MGYRSDVRISTTREGYERICKFVDGLAQDSTVEQLIGAEIKPEHFQEFAGSVIFGWNYLKWYEGTLENVTNVAKALKELSADGIPYEFCRLGESWDDVEFLSCDEDWELALHVEPETSFNIWS